MTPGPRGEPGAPVDRGRPGAPAPPRRRERRRLAAEVVIRAPSLLWFSVGARLALAGLLLLYLARPDLPQFEGKAMWFRAAIYPALAAVVPLLWIRRGRPGPYPHLPDGLLVLPLTADAAGNAADLFRFVEFGWALHFTSMALITSGLGMFLATRDLGRGASAALVLGTGSVLHTLWELLEWAGVAWLGIDLDIRYATTMGDFAAGLGGSTLGALATARFSWPRPHLGGALFADPERAGPRVSGRR